MSGWCVLIVLPTTCCPPDENIFGVAVVLYPYPTRDCVLVWRLMELYKLAWRGNGKVVICLTCFAQIWGTHTGRSGSLDRKGGADHTCGTDRDDTSSRADGHSDSSGTNGQSRAGRRSDSSGANGWSDSQSRADWRLDRHSRAGRRCDSHSRAGRRCDSHSRAGRRTDSSGAHGWSDRWSDTDSSFTDTDRRYRGRGGADSFWGGAERGALSLLGFSPFPSNGYTTSKEACESSHVFPSRRIESHNERK